MGSRDYCFVHVRPRLVHSTSARELAAPATAAAEGGEAELIAGVRARDPRALAELHDRFAPPVLRILTRILGADRELPDLHHDVFVRALRSISELRDPRALRAWMHAIAVHTAHACIERRTRQRRWLWFASKDELSEVEPIAACADHEAREALRAAYLVLDRLPAQERIAFALRYFEEMELADIASACKVSLSSIKRRLARAEERFLVLARRTPALATYVQGSARWTQD